MYIGFLLFTTLIIFMRYINRYPRIVKKHFLLQIIIITFTIIFFTVLRLLIDTEFLGIYGGDIFTKDGVRYLNEINLFKDNIYLLDELNGIYLDYHATSKMGLSSLLAWITLPFHIETKEIYFVLNNLIFLIVSICSLSIFNRILNIELISSKLKVFFGVSLILLPFDLYWITRFLRESIANALFLLFILLSILSVMKQKNYLFHLFILFMFLLLFRSQLALLGSVTLFVIFFMYRKSILYKIVSLFFILISLKQVILASGKRALYEIIDFLLFEEAIIVMDYIQSFNIYYLLFMVFIIILFTYTSKINKYDINININLKYIKLILFANSVIAIILYLFMTNMQIRFIYPFIFYFKLWLIFSAPSRIMWVIKHHAATP
jgi:hypothetical protein